MPVRKRGSSWQVDVRKRGITFRHNYPTEEQADAMLVQVEDAIAKGLPLPDPECAMPQSMTIAELFDRTANRYWSETNWGMTAIRTSQEIVDVVGVRCLATQIDENLVDDLVSFYKRKGNSNGTINKKLSVLSKACQFGFRRGWLKTKPTIEWLKEGKGRIRFVSEDEERQMWTLFRQMGMRDELDTFMFLIDTGMRVGELHNVQFSDLNGDRLTIWKTKNGQPRTVVLTHRAKEIFLRRNGDLSMTPHKVRYSWDRVKCAMGLEHDKQFVPHCLRHTCASRLVQRGVPLLVVKEWLGHNDIKMTLRYSHLCPTNLEDAVKVLEPRNNVTKLVA